MTEKQWWTLAILLGPFIIGGLVWAVSEYIIMKLREKKGL